MTAWPSPGDLSSFAPKKWITVAPPTLLLDKKPTVGKTNLSRVKHPAGSFIKVVSQANALKETGAPENETYLSFPTMHGTTESRAP